MSLDDARTALSRVHPITLERSGLGHWHAVVGLGPSSAVVLDARTRWGARRLGVRYCRSRRWRYDVRDRRPTPPPDAPQPTAPSPAQPSERGR